MIILIVNVSRWRMIIIVLSALVIIVFTNSLQIIVSSVLHSYWSIEAVKIFLHYFDDNGILLLSIGFLLPIVFLLVRCYKPDHATRKILISFSPKSKIAKVQIFGNKTTNAKPIIISSLLLFMLLVGVLPKSKSGYNLPVVKPYDEFPMTIGEWAGTIRKINVGF